MLTQDEFEALVTPFIARLQEHFDTVQIVATQHSEEDGATFTYVKGGGNWYARYGATRAWVDSQTFTESTEPEVE